MLEGLHPNKPTHVMRLATDESAARRMTDLIGEVFEPAETAVAAFESADGSWLLEAYFAAEPDEAAIRELIRPIVGEAAAGAAFELIAQKDWVEASLEDLRPVRAGRFLVHGRHDRNAVQPNDLAIEIEAALAFGTGHHGTSTRASEGASALRGLARMFAKTRSKRLPRASRCRTPGPR